MSSATLRPIQRIRIAASTVAGIFCLFLMLMWVRSFWFNENVMGPAYGNRIMGVSSFEGWLTIRYATGDKFETGYMEPSLFPRWMVQSLSYSEMEGVFRIMERDPSRNKSVSVRPIYNFGWISNWGFQTPYWPAIVIVGMVATVLGWQQPLRFCLRTLLFTTTACAIITACLTAYFRS